MRKPADHLSSTRRRFAAVDHRGRITALVADGLPEGGTALADPPVEGDTCFVHGEDHFGATGGSVTDKSWDGSASRFSDEQYQMATAACDPGSGGDGSDDPTLKAGCFLPHHEPDGTINRNGVHAAAQRVSSLEGHDAGAVARAKAHLRSHYTKDLKEDPPDSISAALDGGDALGADHGQTSTTHTHEHAAYGAQGGDARHSHAHDHSGDAGHNHHRVEASRSAAEEAKRAGLVAALSSDPDDSVERTWVWFGDLPALLPLRHEEGRPEFDEFVSTLPERDLAMVADAGPDLPQLVSDPGGSWQAVLCVEGVMTDECPPRRLSNCRAPDLPVAMRIQIHDEGGHYGAVTCGRIDTMERQALADGTMAVVATGVFGTDEHGQKAQLLVEEQTQRFVSVDLRDCVPEQVQISIIRESAAPLGIVVEIEDDDDDPDDGADVLVWWQFDSPVIGAATIVATPALQQAVIVMEGEELPDAPLATQRAPQPIAASTTPNERVLPRAEWFDDPSFHIGDPRLVRQRGGKYACPFQVEKMDNGARRIFGHICYWGQLHTGFPGKKVTPPRSKAALAHYLTGQGVECEDGETVRGVGQITAGVGHASLHAAIPAVLAHYDGGAGAYKVADVRAGQDDFGVWVAGAVRPEVTDEQIADLLATNLSGDWRGIGGNLELLAVLAGVPVPGFPISREEALVAAANGVLDAAVTRWIEEGDEITALVAANRVQRVSVEERLAMTESALDEVLRFLAPMRAAQLREAKERLMAVLS